MKSGTISILTGSALLSACLAANAEFVGVNIGASHWAPTLDGSFSSDDDPPIDLTDDLGIEDTSQSGVRLSIEHPLPFVPNLRYEGFDLDSSANQTLDSSIDFNGTSFSSGSTIDSTIDLSHEDIVLYYEVLDNWVNLDLGVDLKRFDGEVSLSGTSTSTLAIDEVIPVVYFSARFDLPFSGFYIGANLSNLDITDSNVDDTTLMFGYETGSGMGLEGGLKSFSVELDDLDSLNTDLEYEGLYLNGYINF